MVRKPLTTTHPHGHVLTRKDRALGLLRISKNASTESKTRLQCEDWLAFNQFNGPVVAFLREPVSRFLSSVPETILRMTHFAIAEEWRRDRVVIPEDTHQSLMDVADQPIDEVLRRFLDLVEYSFFDAHHEPQHAFFTDRKMKLRIDPLLYLTEDFETAVAQIEKRTSITTLRTEERGNRGGGKPLKGRTPAIDLARRVTATGVHRQVAHSGFLGSRYKGDPGSMTKGELNALSNQFTRELKSFDLPHDLRTRIAEVYAFDHELWETVTRRGGDVPASELWKN